MISIQSEHGNMQVLSLIFNRYQVVLHPEVVLHGKCDPTVVFEEMLLLQISEPLVEFDQVVVKGGEGSRQGHLHWHDDGGDDDENTRNDIRAIISLIPGWDHHVFFYV